MNLNVPLIAEVHHEAVTTRKCLERLPESAFDWKPHEKSMTLGNLAIHVADMMSWIPGTINYDELDFATSDYKTPVINTTAELVAMFDQKTAAAVAALEGASDEQLRQNWTLRNGDQTYLKMPRLEVIRGMVMNHIVHHRGQLSVYMRMKDIPVPALYGPSADEGSM